MPGNSLCTTGIIVTWEGRNVNGWPGASGAPPKAWRSQGHRGDRCRKYPHPASDLQMDNVTAKSRFRAKVDGVLCSDCLAGVDRCVSGAREKGHGQFAQVPERSFWMPHVRPHLSHLCDGADRGMRAGVYPGGYACVQFLPGVCLT